MPEIKIFGKQNWDDYAHDYQALLHLRPYQELLTSLIDAIVPQPGQHILDAGCGTGNLLVKLVNTTPSLALVGLDRSDPMLAYAKKVCPKATCMSGTLDVPLPFADATFHCVVSSNALYTVQDPTFTISEFTRVLLPGGKLVIANPKAGFNNGLILKEHAKSHLPDSYWSSLHDSPEREQMLVEEAISDPAIAAAMLRIAAANRAIAQTNFHFLSEVELSEHISKSGLIVQDLQLVYARQNLLITATKE